MKRGTWFRGGICLLILGSFLSGGIAGGNEPLSRDWTTDLEGDPLPLGAVARLGSLYSPYERWGNARSIAFSKDDKILAIAGYGNAVRLHEVETRRLLRRLEGHKDEVVAVAYSPDGGALASASWDGTVRLWDAATGMERGTPLQHDKKVICVAFSPDGKILASGCEDGWVRLWDPASGNPVGRLQAEGRIVTRRDREAAEKSVEEDLLPIWKKAHSDKDLEDLKKRAEALIIDALSKANLSPLASHTGAVKMIAFSPDGRTLVSSGSHPEEILRDKQLIPDQPIRVWDVPKKKEVHAFGIVERVGGDSLSFSPDGKFLAVGNTLVKVQTWTVDHVVKGTSNYMPPIVFSPDAGRLATSGVGNPDAVTFLEPLTGRELGKLKCGGGYGQPMAFSYDGKRIAVVGNGGISLFDVATGQARFPSLTGHHEAVALVAISADRSIVATADAFTVILWDGRTGVPVQSFRVKGHILRLSLSPSGRVLAAAIQSDPRRDQQGDLFLWGADAGTEPELIPGFGTAIENIGFSDDETRLFLLVREKGAVREGGGRRENAAVYEWDLAKKQRLGRSLLVEDCFLQARGSACTSDGKVWAASSLDRKLRLRRMDTGALVREIEFPADIPETQFDHIRALSADLKRIVFSYSGAFHLWDLESTKEIAEMPGADMAKCLFSPDGRWLLGGGLKGAEKEIVVWDAGTGAEAFRLRGLSRGVTCLAVSQDGRRLVSGGRGNASGLYGAALVWDLDRVRSEAGQQELAGRRVSETPHRKDARGDLLPEGAVARIGMRSVARSDQGTSVSAVSPDGKLLAIVRIAYDGDAKLALWDLSTGEKQGGYQVPVKQAEHIVFSPDGKRLAMGGRSIGLWDVENRKEINSIACKRSVKALAFTPGGKELVSWHQLDWQKEQGIFLWDGQTGREIPQDWVVGTKEELNRFLRHGTIVPSQDGDRFACRCGRLGPSSDAREGDISIWSREGRKEVLVLKGHTESAPPSVSSVVFSPDGKTLYSSANDMTIRFWDLATGQETKKLTTDTNYISLQVSPDGKVLAHNALKNICLWDLVSGKEMGRLADGPATMSEKPLAFTPDSKRLLTKTRGINVWDIPTGKEVLRVDEEAPIRFLAFAPDGKTVATCDPGGFTQFWEASTGRRLQGVVGERGASGIAFGGDGTVWEAAFGMGASRKGVSLLRQGDPTRRQILLEGFEEQSAQSIAFSQTGELFAASLSTRGSGSVRVWDTSTGKLLHTLGGAGVMRFSPDRKTLAIVGKQHLSLLDIRNGVLVHEIRDDDRTGDLTGAAFSRDGEYLAVIGERGALIYELGSWKDVLRIPGEVRAIEFLADGQHIAFSGAWQDRAVHIWEINSGKEVARLESEAELGTGLSLSSDGTRLASWGLGSSALLWDVGRFARR